ncbi:MAG: cytochrome c biogenesis protein CcdA [Christensenella sp.]
MNEFLTGLSQIITQNIWIGPLVALLAGVLTSFTPCSLSTFPLVIGYVSGNKSGRHSALIYSLLFCLGMTVTFTVLGAVLAVLGQYLSVMGSWWYIILGALMVFMALVMWNVIKIFPSCGVRPVTTKNGGLGAFLLGLLGGAFASPCVTPVLAAILAVISSGLNLGIGILMLITYSVGNSILIVAVGTGMGALNQIGASQKFAKAGKWIKGILGAVILALGLYLFYIGF